MKFERFEDIIVWQKSRKLTSELYGIFGEYRDFTFRNQILRAVMSIMNNIAEGFERKSNKEFKHYLFIAKGSAGEVRSMLYIALELKYIDNKSFEHLYKSCLEISKMLSGLIKTL